MDYVPTTAGDYEFKAIYAGDSENLGSSSSALFTATLPAPTLVTTSIALVLSSGNVQTGSPMHATGTLTSLSGISGATVSLTVVRPDETVAYPTQGISTVTDANGRFAMDYVPTIAGTYQFTATYAGSSANLGSSNSVLFTAYVATPVKSATSITLNLASSSVTTGSNMHAIGVVTNSLGVSGATVSLQVILPDGSVVSPTQGATTVTDSTGHFAMDYVPTTAGNYEFKAIYAGDSANLGSSSSAFFTATSPPVVTDISAKVLVTSSGGTYTAKNVVSGATIISSTNFGTVMTAAFSALSAGRTIKEKVLLQGEFAWSTSVNIPSYTILELDGTANGIASTMLYTTGKSHVEVMGGTWIGGTTSGDECIAFVRCTDLQVHDMEVTSLNGAGAGAMSLMDCTDSSVKNCYLHDTGSWSTQLRIYNSCKNIEVAYNRIVNSGYGGINVFLMSPDGSASPYTADNIWIHHNTVDKTRRAGIGFYPDGNNDKVINSIVEYNTLIDCGYSGAAVAISIGGWAWNDGGTNGPVYDSIIRYNVIRESGAYNCGGGINAGGERLKVYGNECYNLYETAIAFTVGRNSEMYGNIIDTTRYGSGIQILGNNNNVHDNQIKNTRGNGIIVQQFVHPYLGTITSSYNVVNANSITSSASSCVAIVGSAQTNNQVTNNMLISPSTSYPTGISNSGTATIITNNTVR